MYICILIIHALICNEKIGKFNWLFSKTVVQKLLVGRYSRFCQSVLLDSEGKNCVRLKCLFVIILFVIIELYYQLLRNFNISNPKASETVDVTDV